MSPGAHLNPGELVAALVPYLGPGEPLTIPHGLAVALAARRDEPTPRSDFGSGPAGDFTRADLCARWGRSASWVYEHSHEFGPPYRHGRTPIWKRETVLLYEARQRGEGGEGEEKETTIHPLPVQPQRELSPVERRALRTASTHRKAS